MNGQAPNGISRRCALGALASACLGVSKGAHAAAAAASAWSEASHSRLRLIRSSGNGNGQYRAGIGLELKQGYKTYWRHPGDSGVPPVFRFEGSRNLKEAIVHFPAPKRFDDGAGGFSVGYTDPELILPMTVIAEDPREPILLALETDYAVCEKLCVPAHGKASLELRPVSAASQFDDVLKRAMKKVPAVTRMGSAGSLMIKALLKGSKPEHFLVETISPATLPPELFIEGASPWFFDVKPVDHGHFPVLVVEKDKSPDCTGVDITLTLVAAGQSIEVRTRLDTALIAS